MTRSLTALIALLLLGAASAARAQPAVSDPTGAVVARLQAALASGNPESLEPLLAPAIDRAAVLEFSSRWVVSGTTRVTLRERERVSPPNAPVQLVVEALLESGPSARLATWRVDVAPASEAGAPIMGLKTLSALEGLFRLSLDETRQFQATNLRIAAEDLELVVPKGTVFLAETSLGVTGVVVLGRGEMTFHPAPETERGQVRIFSGEDTLRASFDGAFIRLHPSQYLSLINQEALSTAAVDPRALRDALGLFREEVAKSYSVDLADLSDGTWWLVPATTDVLAEVRTRRFGTLTYARAANEAEDVTVFDRDKRRNISVYRSQARIAARGPFYDEDDLVDYDVIDYSLDLAYVPERAAFDGRARLKLKVRANAISSLSLKLASSMQVRAVTTDLFGRVLFLRVRNQDSLVVNLPSTLTHDTEFAVTVVYGGTLGPQTIDTEAIEVQQEGIRRVEEAQTIQPEKTYLYSNRSYWYPQPPVSDYATATMRLTLPAGVGAVCSGDPAAGSPISLRARGDARLLHVFVASQPVRYLGCIFARFVTGDTQVLPLAPAEGTDGLELQDAHARYDRLRIATVLTPRQRGRSRGLIERAAEIARFYAGIMHDTPYPSFTLAVIESFLPGGHSPAYFAALNQPLPASPFTWRDDPANFDNFPDFFLAHELAHQWWGHGIGWRNYHEQWLSEGFAQYFAALYAERTRGADTFGGVIRSMNHWAVETSDQGPVYLGYRLGHLRNDGRVMRALVYNKGAMVLHMLRRFVGDDVFFRSLRRFYAAHRFDKASTDGLREAFTAESGRDLSRFFTRWIYEAELPAIRWTTKTEGQGAEQVLVVRIEQQGERLFDFPITVTLQLADGSLKDVVVAVTDRVAEQRIPYAGALRGVLINRDRAALIRDES
jgi:hypothetical protein